MNNSKQLSILGCGWLGQPLSKHFLKDDFSVKGSVRKQEDCDKISEWGVNAYPIHVGAQEITGDIAGLLAGSETLIISIPPGLRKKSAESFVEKIKNVIPYIERASVKKVIFISSTSVYPNENKTVDEESHATPITESGKQLREVEQLLMNDPNFQTTVLRFGGLIGPKRHPVNFLAGRKNLKNPQAPVNLIHLDDCIHIIQEILNQEKWNEIFNAVAPFHPTKEDYYTEMAELKNLEIPVFNKNQASLGKKVSGEKLRDNLDYQFKVNNRLKN